MMFIQLTLNIEWRLLFLIHIKRFVLLFCASIEVMTSSYCKIVNQKDFMLFSVIDLDVITLYISFILANALKHKLAVV